MKYQIMLEIMFYILARKKVTAKELSERFEISIRTVYRYIDELTFVVPIAIERGAQGGYYIADTFKLSSTFFTNDEYAKLISTLRAVNKELGQDSQLESIINKITATKYNSFLPKLSSESLVIDGGSWGNSAPQKEKIAIIVKAIKDCELIKIIYHNRNGEKTERKIEPYTLVLKQGVWYVYAYCHLRDEFRLFRLGRIESIFVLEKFEKRELDENAVKFDDWYSSVEKDEFILEVNKSIVSDVIDWLGVENVYEKDGKTFAQGFFPFDKGLVFEIMKFGSNVKVVKPEKLKTAILTEATNLTKLYSND